MVEVPTKTEFDALSKDVTHRLGILETKIPDPSILFSDTFSTVYSLADGQTSPDGKWKNKYTSDGKVTSDGQVLTMYPKTVTSFGDTASTLLLSTKSFTDFQLDVDIRPNKQLRQGSNPKTWETPWVFWSYNDEQEGPLKRSNHHYYVVLHTDKFEFGKKDNKVGDEVNEKQIFIKVQPTPFCKMGVSYHLTVIKKGFHITIKVNGAVVVDMDDIPNDLVKMASGFLGLYEEDSNCSFDNVIVKNNQ